MKKILALLLTFVMIMSVALLSVSAENTDISSEIFNVIKEEHKPYFELEKDDVNFSYIKQLTGENYLVRYTISELSYTDDMVRVDIGRYILESSRPLPEIYYNGKLYGIEEAYERRIIIEQDLEIMDTFEGIDFEKVKIPEALRQAMFFCDDDDFIYVRFEVEGSDKEVTDFENWDDDILGSLDKLEQYYDSVHEKLVNEILKDFDHIDLYHDSGYSVVAVKKGDIEAIAESDFVQYMGYISDIHARYIEIYTPYLKGYTFEEICRGYDEDFNDSYVLVKAYGNWANGASGGCRIGDAIVYNSSMYGPFIYQYGIYDIAEDKFYDVDELEETYVKYYRLEDNLIRYASAYPAGDSDGDKIITILDATKIQRICAELESPIYNDDYSGGSYISDIDNDGERTVMDATAIQKLVANPSYNNM